MVVSKLFWIELPIFSSKTGTVLSLFVEDFGLNSPKIGFCWLVQCIGVFGEYWDDILYGDIQVFSLEKIEVTEECWDFDRR